MPNEVDEAIELWAEELEALAYRPIWTNSGKSYEYRGADWVIEMDWHRRRAEEEAIKKGSMKPHSGHLIVDCNPITLRNSPDPGGWEILIWRTKDSYEHFRLRLSDTNGFGFIDIHFGNSVGEWDSEEVSNGGRDDMVHLLLGEWMTDKELEGFLQIVGDDVVKILPVEYQTLHVFANP